MKKLIVVLLIATMLSSNALAQEILFRGIPWGTSIKIAEEEVDDISNYCGSHDGAILPYWEGHTTNPLFLPNNTSYGSGYLCYATFAAGDFAEYGKSLMVAGHYVGDVRMWFRYGVIDGELAKEASDSELYMAQYSFSVMDIASAYEDIKSKMIGIYGEGKETVEDDDGLSYGVDSNGDLVKTEYTIHKKSTIWYGENGTAAKLESSISSRPAEEDYLCHYLNLTYAKTDEDEKLEQVEKLVKAELLKAEAANITSDTSGL